MTNSSFLRRTMVTRGLLTNSVTHISFSWRTKSLSGVRDVKVSLWVGQAASWNDLDEDLTFTFTEDGDAVPCAFGDAFDIDWFDDDFREASVRETPTVTVRELLDRHTSGSAIAKAVAMGPGNSLAEPCNAVVLLYDFEYTGHVKTAQLRVGTLLKFLGSFEIQP